MTRKSYADALLQEGGARDGVAGAGAGAHSCSYLNTAPAVVFYRWRWFVFELTLLLVLMARLTLGRHRDPLAVTSWSNSWMVFALVTHAALHEYFKYSLADPRAANGTKGGVSGAARYVYQAGEPEFLPCGYATFVVIVVAPLVFWAWLRHAGGARGFQAATVEGGRGYVARLSARLGYDRGGDALEGAEQDVAGRGARSGLDEQEQDVADA